MVWYGPAVRPYSIPWYIYTSVMCVIDRWIHYYYRNNGCYSQRSVQYTRNTSSLWTGTHIQ